MNYNYVHCISYYEGSNRKKNLIRHIKKIKELEGKNLCIINIRNTDNNKDRFNYLVNRFSDKIELKILYSFNSGGTVACLYDCYKFLEKENIKYKFIGCFEDDVIFKNNNFLTAVNNYLEKDYIFVGSLWERGRDGVKQYYNEKYYEEPKETRIVPWLKEKNIYPDKKDSDILIDIKSYIWCEDPYITTYENLKKIEDKFGGCFTLAPKNELYVYNEHGINYGEVGFPTRLSLNGFKFIGIDKANFLIDL